MTRYTATFSAMNARQPPNDGNIARAFDIGGFDNESL